MKKANFWKTLGLGLALTTAACAPQKHAQTAPEKDVGNLPTLDEVLEWVKPDSVDCNQCIVDASNFGEPLMVAYVSKESLQERKDYAQLPAAIDSIMGDNDRVLAFDFTLDIDSLLNLPPSNLRKIFNDDMYKSQLPKVTDKTQIYDTVPVFNFEKELTKGVAARNIQAILQEGLYTALTPTEVLGFDVDKNGKHATIRVTAYMNPERMSVVDTAGVYADFEKEPAFAEPAKPVDEVKALQEAKKEPAKESFSYDAPTRFGVAASYFTDGMIGVGPKLSYGNLGIEGQYLFNAPTSINYLDPVREQIGVGELSPSEKILTEEYKTTTANEETMPLFNFKGTIDIPLSKRLSLSAAFGPYFNLTTTNEEIMQRLYFTSTESGDDLGSQPSELPQSNTSHSLHLGGWDADIGLKYELNNGNRLGLRAGAHDVENGLHNNSITFSYEF